MHRHELRRPSPPPHLSSRSATTGLALLFFLCFLPSAVGAQEAGGSDLERIRQEVEDARSSELAYLAPSHVESAAEAVDRAVRRREEGAPLEDVLEAASRARRHLLRARELEPEGRRHLAPGLDARREATDAGAPDRAPEAWREAEAALRDAGREVEDGDAEDARRRAREAADLYRRAARRALEERVMGDARQARAEATRLEARSRAPGSWSRADSLLARSAAALDEAIRSGPGADGGWELGPPSALADSARLLFRRAARYARQAASARRDDGAAEPYFLRYETSLRRLADSLGVSAPALAADPDAAAGARGRDGVGDAGRAGPEAALDSLLADATARGLESLASRARAREELERRLDSARTAARRQEARADSLDAEASRLSGALDTLREELDRRRRRATKIREVMALFSEEEARVLSTGDSLVLRVVGLNFPSGETEIPEEALPVLTKVRTVIQKFPGARIVVEGHTDSRGDEEENRILSQERAIAVREHILTHMPLSADRVSATGLGESRPIASNDTEEGRTLNRRIDVVLELPRP